MTREELQKLFDLSISPCKEGVEWASKQDNQSVEGLLVACQDYNWKKFVANKSRSAVILERLSRDGSWWVRGAVAFNPNTSADVLAGLAGDEDEDVRGWVASNPNTSAAILERLSQDGDKWVREEAARNLERRKI